MYGETPFLISTRRRVGVRSKSERQFFRSISKPSQPFFLRANIRYIGLYDQPGFVASWGVGELDYLNSTLSSQPQSLPMLTEVSFVYLHSRVWVAALME